MNFLGKAFTILCGIGLAGIGGLCVATLLSWPRETTSDLAWLFLLVPAALMLTLSGLYVCYRGLVAGPAYVSPTGTGETGPSK